MAKKICCSCISVQGLGLSIGILFALGAFLMAIFAWRLGIGIEIVNLIGTVYPGYEASLRGAILGGIWAFIDGLIFGAVLAWVYNKLQK